MRFLLFCVFALPLVKCASIQNCKTMDIVLHNGTGEKSIGYKGQTNLPGRQNTENCLKLNFKTLPGLELKHFSIKTSKGVVQCKKQGGKEVKCSFDTDKKGRALGAVFVGAAKLVTMVISGIADGIAVIDWFADSAAGSLHSSTFLPFYVLLSFLVMFFTKKLG